MLGFVIGAALRSGLRLDYPLPYHRWKVGAISVLGSIVALAGAAGIVLVHSALGSVATSGRADVYDKRKRLEELLRLQVTAGESFRTGVAILTPLAGGLVGLLLHTK